MGVAGGHPSAQPAGVRRIWLGRYGPVGVRIQPADEPVVLDDDLIVAGDNVTVLANLPDGAFDLIYMDPPFNTGRAQTRRSLSVVADDVSGDRVGFGGRRYRSRLLRSLSYDDEFGDYLAFLEPRLARARELLAEHGTLYFHIDYREAHYCKLLLDEVFGRDAFLNELIWSYDYGAKPRRRWPAKHDTILVYVRTPGGHWFDADAVEREPYMAPGLVSAREGRPREAADRRVVPHDRADQRPGEDRLPDAEARRRAAQDGGRVVAPGGVVPGSVRGLGHARRRVPGARPAVRAGRLESGGDRGDARRARLLGGSSAVDKRDELDRLELPAD